MKMHSSISATLLHINTYVTLFSNPQFYLFLDTHYICKGVEILAFPCNQFGGQEPGSDEKIQELACTRFKAEYPIFRKVCDFF
jgi:glutathione peroxidase-family protein